jgi:hypothetical protein
MTEVEVSIESKKEEKEDIVTPWDVESKSLNDVKSHENFSSTNIYKRCQRNRS